MPSSPEERKPLRRADAAAYITEKTSVPCASATLARLATQGGGPKFFKVGHLPFYAPEYLDAWITSKTSEKVSCSGDLSRRQKVA